MMKYGYLLLLVLLFLGCGSEEGSGPIIEPMEDLPSLTISDRQVLESTPSLSVRLVLDQTTDTPIEVAYEVVGETAQPGLDFVGTSSTVTIEANNDASTIIIELLDDEIKEVDETIMIRVLSADGADIVTEEARIRVLDNDNAVLTEEGYNTAEEQFGYSMAWQDEFNGSTLDEASFNFELGDGCPNLCGWGNNELRLM